VDVKFSGSQSSWSLVIDDYVASMVIVWMPSGIIVCCLFILFYFMK